MTSPARDRTPVRDQLQRPVRDLRISVTDRCNLRCVYCMPKEVYGASFPFLPRAEILSFEEIVRVARALVGLGVRKVRLTGGEPLVRRDLHQLVASLAGLPGVEDIALTTNGLLLPSRAAALRAAGLRRLTVSLDAIDDGTFRAMTDVGVSVERVLTGIAAARAAGFDPIKINAVVKRGVNDQGMLALAAFAREQGHILRFIEYMDVGHTNGWRLDAVVPASELRDRLDATWPLEPLPARYPGEVATRYRYRDGGGEVGIIASVTRPFCGACTRARLSADGRLFTCLFAGTGHDLRPLLRGGADDDGVTRALEEIWRGRADRYSELRSSQTTGLDRVEMSYIGG